MYFYDGLAGDPSVADADALIDQVANREKAFHSTAVTFVRGRLWRQTDDKATTEMISQKNLSGVGARASVSSFDKERAFLFRIRAGVDIRGNPVYLRKWFHACGEFVSGQGAPASILTNQSGWSQAERDAQVAAMNSIGSVGSGGTLGTLVSKKGRTTTAGQPWTAHQFLEHHNMGDMWRAQ